MKIRVMKFGGTSTATDESREHLYSKVLTAYNEGFAVVVVVSAMGRRGAPYATDTMLDMLLSANADMQQRELDIMAFCSDTIGGLVVTAGLQKLGYKSIFLSGEQAGIRTNGVYGDARVTTIHNERLLALLKDGYIPVIPSGQGATEDGEWTFLGRGGGDTSACALGVALGASSTEIYTDVVGVMTADPRIILEARLIKQMSFQTCINMAHLGAKVMHPRSVETAAQDPTMKLYVRSTMSDLDGTLICSKDDQEGVIGISYQESDAIFIGEIDNLLAKNLEEAEVVPQRIDGSAPVFAINEKELKRFMKLAPDFKQVCKCDKVSMIGRGISQYPDLSELGTTVLYQKQADGYLSLWVDKNGKEVARQLHKAIK